MCTSYDKCAGRAGHAKRAGRAGHAGGSGCWAYCVCCVCSCPSCLAQPLLPAPQEALVPGAHLVRRGNGCAELDAHPHKGQRLLCVLCALQASLPCCHMEFLHPEPSLDVLHTATLPMCTACMPPAAAPRPLSMRSAAYCPVCPACSYERHQELVAEMQCQEGVTLEMLASGDMLASLQPVAAGWGGLA